MARIVLVNDEEDLVEMCKMVLEEVGHDVDGLIDPDRALDLMLQNPPDVIVLDWMMRDRTADDLLRQIRRASSLARAPVLIVSALADGAEKARLYGADAFLAKPFSAEALVASVDRLTARAVS
jgi:DNA-binding response OmpR family regulator